MASLIDQAKQIPASTIAEGHGMILKQHGERYWACCPFHAENHPSMCFYPDGSWYCFSCKKGGDSVALKAELLNLSMYDAAKKICGDYHLTATAGPEITSPHEWKNKRVKHLRKIIQQADEYTGQYTAENAEQAWADPIFRAAILAKKQANNELDELYAADSMELERLMKRGCRPK